MRISDWSSDVCSSDLDEDVDGALRGVIAVEDVRYPVVEHPRGAGRVGDHLVQRLRIDAGADTEGHRLGRGGDVHAGEELVDGLHRRADAMPPQKIKALRENAHMTQAVFAAVLNTSLSTVQKWKKTGERRVGTEYASMCKYQEGPD